MPGRWSMPLVAARSAALHPDTNWHEATSECRHLRVGGGSSLRICRSALGELRERRASGGESLQILGRRVAQFLNLNGQDLDVVRPGSGLALPASSALTRSSGSSHLRAWAGRRRTAYPAEAWETVPEIVEHSGASIRLGPCDTLSVGRSTAGKKRCCILPG